MILFHFTAIFCAFLSAPYPNARAESAKRTNATPAVTRIPYFRQSAPLANSYRPGQKINALLECLREPTADGARISKAHFVSSCQYRITDPLGKTVDSLKTSPPEGAIPSIGIRVEYRIPADAPLGTYLLEAQMEGPGLTAADVLRRSFTVSRPSDRQVEVRPASRQSPGSETNSAEPFHSLGAPNGSGE